MRHHSGGKRPPPALAPSEGAPGRPRCNDGRV